MGYYIGIDLGTSGVKALLMDAAQNPIAEATAPLTVQRPKPGWSEQGPGDWIAAAVAVMDDIAARHPDCLAALRGIGLSGQMHGATILGRDDIPLRPAILWNDGRSVDACRVLDDRADFRGIGGNLVMPGFTAPKIEWLRGHEPDVFDRISKILLPKDYLRLTLTGDHISDMSDSAGTLWLDVGGRDWSPDLLAATGLTRAQMPDLVEGTAPGGVLRSDLAARWGIKRAPVVAGGGGDNAASAVAVGAVEPGTGFLSLGTSGVLFASGAAFAPNTDHAAHAFCHAVPDTWHQMGVILAATDALNWLSAISRTGPAELAGLAANAPADHGVIALPYLSGERTPHNTAAPQGAFAGLGQSTDLGVLARAMMEAVGFAFADCTRVLQATGNSLGPVVALGGGAQSHFWLQTIASITGLTLQIPDKGAFGAAFGAARLAIVAAGDSSVTETITPIPIAREIAPQSAEQERLGAAYARYQATYPALTAALT